MLDPRTELADNHVQIFNPTGQVNESWGPTNFGARARKTAQNYENYRNWNGGGVQFIAETMEDESGVSSPPLWKTSPARSPPHSRHPQNNYRYLSPNSRTQAIARGQWELMEMVKNMPESSYELSLRDLVEHPRVETREECLVEEKRLDVQPLNQRVKVTKRQESKKNDNRANTMRSRSIENGGLLLKMVFPISLGAKKKKTSTTNTYSRVSPKPDQASDKSSKGVDKEWWKKRFSVSSESESGATSSNSGSTGSSGSSGSSRSSRSNSIRKSSSCVPGCWSFIFLSKKNKKTAK